MILKRVAYCTPLIFLPVTTALAAGEPLNTPLLEGASNFRDIAGITTAYSTANDGTMRGGVFYRSNALLLTPDDLAVVNTLGISDVFDLRTPGEAAAHPDVLPAGANYLNVNIIGEPNVSVTSLSPFPTTPDESRALMEQGARDFVTDDDMREQLRILFVEMANAEDAAIFHCSAGKDRTGWTAAVLQLLAGVDEATVLDNYLASNANLAAENTAILSHLPPTYAAIFEPLLGVEASYLQAGLEQLQTSYGSLDAYLKEGLGLDQETIYVLRGKIVRYISLPGQDGLTRNAAAGAGLLVALQDSALAGSNSDYNYYLQSAIDSGSLGGVEASIGGQVHADSVAHLLRQPRLIEDAIEPYASGRALDEGESRVSLAAFGGYLGTDGADGIANSNGHTQGVLALGTRRLSSSLTARTGFSYSRNSVGSAGADADVDLALLTLGGRYGFDGLDRGAYVDLALEGGWIDYDSSRQLGGGLGRAEGDSNGTLFAGSVRFGYRLIDEDRTLEPSIGLRTTHVDVDGFRETGSELALDVAGLDKTVTTLVTNIDIGLGSPRLGNWALQPGLRLGYERALGSPQVESQGEVQGFTIRQVSAHDSRDLLKVGANLKAHYGALTLSADVSALEGGDSHGLSGSLSANFRF